MTWGKKKFKGKYTKQDMNGIFYKTKKSHENTFCDETGFYQDGKIR